MMVISVLEEVTIETFDFRDTGLSRHLTIETLDFQD